MTRDCLWFEKDLRDLSESTPRGLWLRQHPEPFGSFGGDLLIVLSDAEFVSFASRIGDRMLVAIGISAILAVGDALTSLCVML
jgi:hypothetical protein